MNTSKIYLHMEQFSLETNWKLAEVFLYNQSCKKDTHIIGSEGKKSDWVKTCAPGRGLIGRGRVHQWTPTLGSEQFKP